MTGVVLGWRSHYFCGQQGLPPLGVCAVNAVVKTIEHFQDFLDVGELAWMELGECLWWDDPWVSLWASEFDHALSVFENGEGE